MPPPMPEMMPANVVELMLPPTVRVLVARVTLPPVAPPPASGPIV
jgi:hypothetical protein